MKAVLHFLFIALFFFGSINFVQSQDTIPPTPVEEPLPEPTPKPAKQKKGKPLRDKLYFGGSVGMSFGNYTMIGVYPLVGYKLTPKLSGGVRLSYQYISDSRYSTTYTTSNYGGSVFARFRVTQQIYLHAEYETLSYELLNGSDGYYRQWIPFFYVGGGYSKRLGGNTWLHAQVLFDVLQDSNSPYGQWEPFLSIGISSGF